MNAGTERPDRHPDDGALLRLVDGAGAAAERARTGAHVERCDRCDVRLRRLRADKARVLSLLAETEAALPTPPARLRTGADAGAGTGAGTGFGWIRGWRAAAVIAILLAGSAGVQPVRAWVVERARAVAVMIGAVEPAPAPAADGTTPRSPAAGGEPGAADPPAVRAEPVVLDSVPGRAADTEYGPMVVFLPEGDEFTVEVARPESGSRLIVRIEEVSAASIEVRGGAGLKGVRVRPDGLTVANASGPPATYDLLLPAGVRRVRVEVGGRTVARIEATAMSLPLRRAVDLGPEPGGR